MKNLAIGARLAIAFGLVLVLLLAGTLLGASRLQSINDSTVLIVNDRYPKVMLGVNSLDTMKDIAIAQRNMLIADDAQAIAAEKAKIADRQNKVDAFLDRLARTASTQKGRQIFEVLKLAKKQYETDQSAYFAMVDSGQKVQAKKFLMTDMAAHQDAYFQQIRVLIDLGGILMSKSSSEVNDLYLSSAKLMGLLAALALLLSGAMAYWISRSITVPMAQAVVVARSIAQGDLSQTIAAKWQDETGRLLGSLGDMNTNLGRIVSGVRVGSEMIASASREIADGTMDLSARTEQQAAALEQTAASMAQLSGAVRQNASQAQDASRIARSAVEMAVQGGKEMSEIALSMAQIRDSSQRIAAIIGVIDGIAFQTNILALNAAVEAARAGEQGRGFAVVAGEVRNLAQRAAAAAREIKQLIEDSAAKVDAGDRFAGKIGMTMNQVVEQIGRVSSMTDAIDCATREQMTGIEQVNLAIAQIDQSTQQNAALVEQAAAAAASMQNQTKLMAESVNVFVLQ